MTAIQRPWVVSVALAVALAAGVPLVHSEDSDPGARGELSPAGDVSFALDGEGLPLFDPPCDQRVTTGCGIQSMNDCRWQPPFFPSDPVEERMAGLGIVLDGDLTDGIGAGAVSLVDLVPDSFDNPPGDFGDDERPRFVGDPNGFNIARSVLLFVPDSDPTDGIDDSFLYLGWDISDFAQDDDGPPRAYDSDDNDCAWTVEDSLFGKVFDKEAESYRVELQACTGPEAFTSQELQQRNPQSISDNQDAAVLMDINETFRGLSLFLNPCDLDVIVFPTASPSEGCAPPYPDCVNPTNACIDNEIEICAPWRCSESRQACVLDTDCPVDQTCHPENNIELVIKEAETSGPFGPRRACTATGEPCRTDCDCPQGETCVPLITPDSDEARVNRFALAQLLARFRAGSVGDGSDEEFANVALRTSLPSIEVTKEVRCVGEDDTTWREQAEALPGAEVEYRITIRNTGNEDLDVTVCDVMRGIGPHAGIMTCEPVCESMQAFLTSPGRGILDLPISLENAAGPPVCDPILEPKRCLDSLFFQDTCANPDVGFLGSIRNEQCAHLGTLLGANCGLDCNGNGVPDEVDIAEGTSLDADGNGVPDECDPFGPRGRTVFLGDTLVILFRGRVDVSDNEAFCGELAPADCENVVTAGGPVLPRSLPDVTPCADPPNCCDANSDCDDGLFCNGQETCVGDVCNEAPFCVCQDGPDPCLPEEGCDENTDTCGAVVQDSDSVTVDVKCRQVELVKDVGPVGGPHGDTYYIPDGPWPDGYFDIEYKYTVTNGGEVDEAITLIDKYLCVDVCGTPGVDFISCDLCPSGCPCASCEVTETIPAGQTREYFCSVRFQTPEALRAFLQKDDGRPDCRAELPNGDPNPECYKDCAQVSGTATGLGAICPDGGTITSSDEAIICLGCAIAVDKRVRCVLDDPTNPNDCETPSDDPAQFGPWKDDVLEIAQGGCAQIEVTVRNEHSTTPICRLHFRDQWTATDEFELVPGTVELECEGTTCAPPPDPFDFCFIPEECCPGGQDLMPDQTVTLRYVVRILPGADPADPDPNDTMTVRGFIREDPNDQGSTCLGSCDPLQGFSCEAEDSVALDIQPRCELTVTKGVKCKDDPGPCGDSVEAVPGATLTFCIEACNTGSVRIPRICIDDVLTCPDWFVPSSVGCEIRTCDTNILIDDVTDCICPGGCDEVGDINECYTFEPPCRTSGGPGLAPNEKLVITFDVQVPPDFSVVGDDPDCINTVTVTGDSGVECAPVAGPLTCDGTGSAEIDVKDRALVFTKQVGPPGGPYVDEHAIPKSATFPYEIEYKYTVTNNGEVDEEITLTDKYLCVDVCDTDDVDFVSCDLCPLGCPCPPCQLTDTVPAGESREYLCRVRFETMEALLEFLELDDGRTDCRKETDDGESAPYCYRDCANLTGSSGICGAEDIEETDFADICYEPPCCLEVTKRVRCILDDCDNPTSYGPYFNSDPLSVIPGACAEFEICAENTGLVPIPLVCITDTLSCFPQSWYVPGSLHAEINGDDVTDSLAGFALDGGRRCFIPADGAGPRPIAPGESLCITFRVRVPDNATTDCQNCVIIEGYSLVGEPDPPALDPTDCCRDEDCAYIQVDVPRLDCVKEVAVDEDAVDDPGIDHASSSLQNLTAPVYPMDLTYIYTIKNSGELPINDVRICDTDLVADAVAAGLEILSCELCDEPADPTSCDGIGDECSPTVDLPAPLPGDPPTEATFTCTLRVPDQDAWDVFAALDPDGDDHCYENTARAEGDVDTTDVCVEPGFDNAISSPECDALVCVTDPAWCPVTKAVFDIWNELEIKFSETERCIVSWDQTLLSEYTELGIPNAFLISFLGTSKGKARIDGVRSPAVCGSRSLDAPLLGVAAKVLDFPSGKRDMTGITLVGMGVEAGRIEYDLPSAPLLPPDQDDGSNGSLVKGAVLAATADAVADPGHSRRAQGLVSVVGQSTDGQSNGSGADRAPGDVSRRASASAKGSLLVYAKVEIKWDANGVLAQDTFLDITNDANLPVNVQFYLVNGDQPVAAEFDPVTGQMVEREHPGCNHVDFVTALTMNQPQFWSAATGQGDPAVPFTAPPFEVLDPAFDANGNGVIDPFERAGRPDPDPLNPGGRMLRGYLLAWTVDSPEGGPEIHWNHLKGDAFIANYQQTAAWEQNAWSFRAVAEGKVQGDVLLDPLGTLDLNGDEYDWAPARLLFDFYAAGGTPFVIGSAGSASVDTDLTLWVAVKSLKQP